MNSPQWASLKSVKEGQSLPTLILLRLAITYNLDEYPGLTLTQMADFEPRIEAKEVNGRLVWEYRSMTIDGDIYLSIDALTGVLLKVETSKGGNG